MRIFQTVELPKTSHFYCVLGKSMLVTGEVRQVSERRGKTKSLSVFKLKFIIN